MSDPIWQWSATRTARAIREREVSALEVTRAHIERMQAVNPQLNAVVVDLSDTALAAAEEADRAAARGDDLGPLHGVPITVKTNVDYQGQANSNGVAAMKGLIAPSDSPVVGNLRRAGAITLGLTNTPEFSLRAVTDNPLHGLTLNPWDESITCGGSSGGAGAALAAGIGALAHGNDIGGSLRWPAHCNGVATIRPTLGRVPAFNETASAERPIAAQLFSVQGPMARSVADVRLGLDVMRQGDARDPWWVPAPLAGASPGGPIRIGVAPVTADMNPDPEVMAQFAKAAEYLAAEGHVVEEIEVPELEAGWDNWFSLLMAEIHTLQEEAMRAVASPDFSAVLDSYLAHARKLDLPGYMQALAERSRHIRNWSLLLERYPVILAPVVVQKTFGARADLDGPERVLEMWRDAGRYIGTMNHLGLPSAVVPVGLAHGLPVGVQLVAGRYREDLALAAAGAIEKHAGALVHRLWARGDHGENP
ncbi:MAG TPA: amidase [Aliiroseovarius sp.]|nr:amidase [Aliiroseovarius sp.]